jgi:hypothetical protein
MQTLTIINGLDEVVATQTVSDNITKEQIGDKIKHLLRELSPFARYTLQDTNNNKPAKIKTL